jgi:hypothetical protein
VSDRTLFDPDRTIAVECTVCGATRQPGEPTAPSCSVDRDRSAGDTFAKRPRACLNTVDPATAPFPPGY